MGYKNDGMWNIEGKSEILELVGKLWKLGSGKLLPSYYHPHECDCNNIDSPLHSSNSDVRVKRPGVKNIVNEIMRRRWKYIEHLLRMDNNRHVKKVLTWTPQGTRKPGRQKGTLRRDIAAEIKRNGSTWSQIDQIAKDRTSWRSLVDALCVEEHEED
ncbi:Hypothetical predicted protein [Mytilus galloprovincialis]|uniref:Uncharacterized protein n=1 Tax=Mytilus galloprovincialis TaxID=29158 RepID=A0A8B6CA69_MYTGA|nr:Hypothetical predicted protein [Mytilus galloprovincialis]